MYSCFTFECNAAQIYMHFLFQHRHLQKKSSSLVIRVYLVYVFSLLANRYCSVWSQFPTRTPCSSWNISWS